jgi:hypothetical protein
MAPMCSASSRCGSPPDPERGTHVVRIQRSLDGGAYWEPLSTDSSSPVYTAYDNLASVPVGAEIRYRAILTEPDDQRGADRDPDRAAATGAQQAASGSDILLVLEAPSQVTFVWDQVTHIPQPPPR